MTGAGAAHEAVAVVRALGEVDAEVADLIASTEPSRPESQRANRPRRDLRRRIAESRPPVPAPVAPVPEGPRSGRRPTPVALTVR